MVSTNWIEYVCLENAGLDPMCESIFFVVRLLLARCMRKLLNEAEKCECLI